MTGRLSRLAALTGIAVAFLLLPLIAVFTQGSLRDGFHQSGAWTALRISFETSGVSLGLMIVFGTPITGSSNSSSAAVTGMRPITSDHRSSWNCPSSTRSAERPLL